MVRQIAHFAGKTALRPVLKAREIRGRTQRSDARQREPDFRRYLADELTTYALCYNTHKVRSITFSGGDNLDRAASPALLNRDTPHPMAFWRSSMVFPRIRCAEALLYEGYLISGEV